MLDLRILARKLTQGQPAASMVLGGPSMPAGPPDQSPPEMGTPTGEGTPVPPSVDPVAVARRVQELMRRELGVVRDRRGGSIR